MSDPNSSVPGELSPTDHSAEVTNTPPPPLRREINPWTMAFVIMLLALAGFLFVGPFIGAMIAIGLYPGEIMDFMTDLADPIGKDYMRSLMLIIQGCSTFVGLAVVPTFFWIQLKKRKLGSLFTEPKVKAAHLLLAAGIILFFIGFDSVIVEWNAKLDLPDGTFETVAKDMEKKLGDTVKWLAAFDSIGQYLFGLLVIAVFPAIAEELVFRGYLQPELQKSFRNPHVGIWLAAFLFSALHMQFYGFVPRLLLGAVMGYMYYWSKNMWVPIVAHFVNNYVALTTLYVSLKHIPEWNADDAEALPWYVVAVSTVVFAALMYRFYTLRNSTDEVRS